MSVFNGALPEGFRKLSLGETVGPYDLVFSARKNAFTPATRIGEVITGMVLLTDTYIRKVGSK